MTEGSGQRLDKWLWHARFFKTRTLATEFVRAGKLRLNGDKTDKPHYGVKAGDVLTFPKAREVRVIKVLGFAARRGPYAEARLLYDDLTPEAPAGPHPGGDTPERPQPAILPGGVPRRAAGAGRPTKKERREIDKLRGEDE